MDNKKLIVRIAEGIGNQLFMYANGYALSKKINYDLFIDPESAYFKKKDLRKFELSNFNITAKSADNKDKFNNNLLNIKRLFLKKIDKYSRNKRFIIENRNKEKNTKYSEFDLSNLSNKVYVEGNFESEKYFKNYKNDLKKEFLLKNDHKFQNNEYYDIIKKNNNNVISICIRTNRFSERIVNKNDQTSINKSNEFTKDTISYVKRAIDQIELKIKNPIFLLWSNDFTNLREYFPENKFIFVENNIHKSLTDFYLLTKCKNFIVGPTSFHWWPAWLNVSNNSIVFRPMNINNSKNHDFWPENWVSI